MKTLKLSVILLFAFCVASAFRLRTLHDPFGRMERKEHTADTFNIGKYKGKVVVLHFWASWSKLSRTENKNLVRVFQSYRLNPDVVFAGVSLDTDLDAWKSAITEDELSWKEHFCDTRKYESPAVKRYGITTIPRYLVFDKSGNLVHNAPNAHQIDATVANLLK